MSPITRRILVVVALVLLGLVVLGGIFLGVMYWFPGNFFFGFSGVRQQNVYTKFFGADVENMFNQRNFIINSDATEIQIRITKPEQQDEAAMTLFEHANGFSWNRQARTDVEWMQIVHDCGNVFYKITLHEPQGAISRQAVLYINLVADDVVPGSQAVRPYNFIFNTGGGHVSFRADLDPFILVDTLTINGNGTFNFPPATAPFRMDINNLVINSSSTVDTRGLVRRAEINANSGRYTFGRVGTPGVTTIPGWNGLDGDDNVLLVGGNGNVVTTQNIYGNVNFTSRNGGLTASEITGALFMRSNTADANLLRVTGNIDFETTNNGALGVTDTHGRVTFNSTNAGSLGITNPHGIVEANVVRATINLGTRGGARSHVEVENRYGNTTVLFALDLTTAPTLFYRGHHGNLTATNVRGQVDIMITAGGRGRVMIGFRQIVAGDNIIEHQGSTQPNVNWGNIDVTLQRTNNSFLPFDLRVENTRGARDRTGWTVGGQVGNTNPGLEIPNGQRWPINGGNTNNRLTIRTSNVVTVLQG